MCKTSHCCCCFGVRTGTMIIGVLCWVGMLDEIQEFHPVRFVARLITALTFLSMLIDNTGSKRGVFFFTYTALVIVGFIVGTYIVYGAMEEAHPWEYACKDMEKKH